MTLRGFLSSYSAPSRTNGAEDGDANNFAYSGAANRRVIFLHARFVECRSEACNRVGRKDAKSNAEYTRIHKHVCKIYHPVLVDDSNVGKVADPRLHTKKGNTR